MEKYVKLSWPESQKFIEYEECYTVTNEEGGSITFIPEELYNEITYKTQFPKEYDTNLGKINCYEHCALIDNHKPFIYDREIKRGDIVLIYNQDIPSGYNRPEWFITKVKCNSEPLPILLEDPVAVVGINCEIIGSYNPNYDN